MTDQNKENEERLDANADDAEQSESSGDDALAPLKFSSRHSGSSEHEIDPFASPKEDDDEAATMAVDSSQKAALRRMAAQMASDDELKKVAIQSSDANKAVAPDNDDGAEDETVGGTLTVSESQKAALRRFAAQIASQDNDGEDSETDENAPEDNLLIATVQKASAGDKEAMRLLARQMGEDDREDQGGATMPVSADQKQALRELAAKLNAAKSSDEADEEEASGGATLEVTADQKEALRRFAQQFNQKDSDDDDMSEKDSDSDDDL